MAVIEAVTGAELAIAAQLFREYQEELDVDLCFQGFEEELATLPGRYAPPRGSILLARVDAEVVGCVAVRPIADGICEMKRLFVRPPFRGRSIGRELAEAIIARSKSLGYGRMRLDTLVRLERANELYARLGFVRTDPYYDNPLDGVVYWELVL